MKDFCLNCVHAVHVGVKSAEVAPDAIYCKIHNMVSDYTKGCSHYQEPFDEDTYHISKEAELFCRKRYIKTNADRIRAMNDDELAEYLSQVGCRHADDDAYCLMQRRCKDCWLDGLREECDP